MEICILMFEISVKIHFLMEGYLKQLQKVPASSFACKRAFFQSIEF